MDHVFIEGLRLSGKHGVHEHERRESQDFLVDIKVSIDTRAAAGSDNLTDTVDYSHFASTAKTIVEGESFYLIERLAATICERILEDTRIPQVEVTIRKPAALKNGLPGVTIIRTQ